MVLVGHMTLSVATENTTVSIQKLLTFIVTGAPQIYGLMDMYPGMLSDMM